MRILIFLSLILFAFSCKSTKDAANADDPNKEENKEIGPEDIVFMMKKGACFGTCPVYTLRIYNNRYTEFVGKKHTNLIGTHSKEISKEQYESLVTGFDEADFLNLEDAYQSNIPDLPAIKLSYHKDGTKKTIVGKRERPEVLHKLQFQLEKIVQEEGWTKVSDNQEPEKKESKLDKSKVVVEIAKGNELARWFTEMRQQYSVQIIKSLSPTNDKWLIAFNPKEHNPETFLKLLNEDPVIKSAAFQVVK